MTTRCCEFVSDDKELAALKATRRRELLKQMEQRKRLEDAGNDKEGDDEKKIKEDAQQAQLDTLLQQIMTPEAWEYIRKIQTSKPGTYSKLTRELITFVRSGSLMGRLITLLGVKRLERDVDGVEPSIRIKRRGEDERLLR